MKLVIGFKLLSVFERCVDSPNPDDAPEVRVELPKRNETGEQLFRKLPVFEANDLPLLTTVEQLEGIFANKGLTVFHGPDFPSTVIGLELKDLGYAQSLRDLVSSIAGLEEDPRFAALFPADEGLVRPDILPYVVIG